MTIFHVSQAFQHFDENKCGRIPLSEVWQVLRTLGTVPPERLLNLLLASNACQVDYNTLLRYIFQDELDDASPKKIKSMNSGNFDELLDFDVLLDTLGEFKPAFSGNVTPLYPSDISRQDASAIYVKSVGKQGKENQVAVFPHHIVQRGKVNSIWLRFQSTCCIQEFIENITIWEETLKRTMEPERLTGDTSKGWRKDAALGFASLFVGFPEGGTFTSNELKWLLDKGFEFSRLVRRRTVDAFTDQNEIVYVKWVGKAAYRLQPWATSIAGTRAFTLSDDLQQVCLIRENKNVSWGTPGGAVEMKEPGFESTVRELWEETGLKADLEWCQRNSVVLGGYHAARARDELISDAGFVYAIKVLPRSRPRSDSVSTNASTEVAELEQLIKYITPAEQKEEAKLEEIKQVIWVSATTLAALYDYFMLLEETKDKIRPAGLFGSVSLKTVRDELFDALSDESKGTIDKDDKIDCGVLCWAKNWVEGKGLKMQTKSGRFG
mmetsp:Transcript_162370/g.299506  ORF Transcript_162370/g.299506 Transcript_162370/m.299506 type:complete len:494 (+) Transcript_162370:59-1540(+)